MEKTSTSKLALRTSYTESVYVTYVQGRGRRTRPPHRHGHGGYGPSMAEGDVGVFKAEGLAVPSRGGERGVGLRLTPVRILLSSDGFPSGGGVFLFFFFSLSVT